MKNFRFKRLQTEPQYPVLIRKPENLLYLTGSFFADPAQLLVFPAVRTAARQAARSAYEDSLRKRAPVLFGGHLEKVAGIKKKDSLQNIGKYLGREVRGQRQDQRRVARHSADRRGARGGAGRTARRSVSLEIEDHLTIGEKREIMRNLKGVKLLPSRHHVEKMRLIKDKDELAAIRHSMEICGRVLERVKRALRKKPWREIELARFIRIEGLKLGADGTSFEPIVAAGPNAAIPHHKPGRAPILSGQSIILDFGFKKVDGYCSDFTRTVFIKRAPDRLRQIYEHTETAFRAALAAARDGLPAKQLDAVARDYLKKQKLDKYFIHGLGHGIGLEVHEAPRLAPNSRDILKNGMVFSIEPGVYIPRLGGIRIEDLVYLEQGKAKSFIKASTPLEGNLIK